MWVRLGEVGKPGGMTCTYLKYETVSTDGTKVTQFNLFIYIVKETGPWLDLLNVHI